MQIHYLSQCWVIVNWTLENKIQQNSKQYTRLCIIENAFENVVCETTAILSRERWVNHVIFFTSCVFSFVSFMLPNVFILSSTKQLLQSTLTHCSLVKPFDIIELGSGNGLSDGTSSSSEPVYLCNHIQFGTMIFNFSKFHSWCSKSQLLVCLKVTYLKLLLHLPGANKLILFYQIYM